MYEIQNATVDYLDWVMDHGCLCLSMGFRFDSGGQGFGSIAVDMPPEKRELGHKRRPTVVAGSILADLLHVFGVEELSKIVGMPCRISRSTETGMLVNCGHFLKDRWFNPLEHCGLATKEKNTQ